MKTRLFIVLLVCAASTCAWTVSISDIKIFVFTREPDEGQLVTPEATARNKRADAAVQELKRDFAKKLAVVEQRDQADVAIEVLPRPEVKAGTPTPDRDSTKSSAGELNISLVAGAERLNLTGRRSAMPPRPAIRDVAEQIEKWIRDNRDKLIAKRATVIGPATVTK